MAKKQPNTQIIFNWHRFSEQEAFTYLYSYQTTELHTHTDFYEFALVTSGEFDNVYENKHHKLTKNTLIFFKLGESHAIYTSQPNSIHFTFLVKKDLMDELLGQYFPQVNFEQLPSYIERALYPVQGEYLTHIANQLIDNNARNDRPQWMHLWFFTAFSACLMESAKDTQTAIIDQYVEDIIEHFNNGIFLTYSVSQICSYYPISKSILIKKFKEHTGYTIVQYHTMKKLDYAAQLLSSAMPITITEVCAAINYTNTSHFARIFRERFHMNPKEYQRAHIRYAFPSDKPVVANKI